jgi:hypothetical protein
MFTSGLAARWAAPGLLAILGSAAAVVWVVRHWADRGRDPRVGLVGALVVTVVPASIGGLSAVRFIGVALLGLCPLAAMATTQAAAKVRRRLNDEPRGLFKNPRLRFWADGQHWRPVLAVLPLVLLPGVVLMTLPLGRPLADIAAVQRLPQGCRLVSDPGSAASVILLRPDVKVWIDGRADYYGRQRNMEAVRLLSSHRTDQPPLDRATCVVLRRDGHFDVEPLVEALDADPAWRRLLSDKAIAAWARQ